MCNNAQLVIGENVADEGLPNIGANGKIDTDGELLRCPRCGNCDVHTDQVDYDHNHVYKYFVCDVCGAKWVEEYVFDSAYMID